MHADEKRSHRLNHLLQYYLQNKPSDGELFAKAKSLGVSDPTARDYASTVKIQALRSRKSDSNKQES